MDDDKAAAIANALEALQMNQTALRAAVEEVSTWIRQRGSVSVHDNVMTTLEALDLQASTLTSVIELLRT